MKPCLRQSRRPIPSSLDYGSGTWTEVLYWLSRRAAHSRRQALRAQDLQLVHNYRINAEVCEAVIGYLDHNLRFQAFKETWDKWADNRALSAHSTLLPCPAMPAICPATRGKRKPK